MQTPSWTCQHLRTRQAEGTGFALPHRRQVSMRQALASKCFSDKNLPQSGCSGSFPVVTRCGGRQPGQILDKSASPVRRHDRGDEHRFLPTEPIFWDGRLAALSKRCKKRLIGASDGFDLSNPNSDLLITMFGLVSRLFIKGLREKVRRGMRGAARRGTVLGKLPLGFTRKIHRDNDGNVVCRPDGRPRHEPCIDPETQKYRVLTFELFSVKKWSPYQIARHFNDLKIDGWDGWTEAGIIKLLVGLDAMGIFIWNRTHREYDVEEDKVLVVPNPRSEWEVYIDPKLRLVPVPRRDDYRRSQAVRDLPGPDQPDSPRIAPGLAPVPGRNARFRHRVTKTQRQRLTRYRARRPSRRGSPVWFPTGSPRRRGDRQHSEPQTMMNCGSSKDGARGRHVDAW